jgi:hypothetical protein
MDNIELSFGDVNWKRRLKNKSIEKFYTILVSILGP